MCRQLHTTDRGVTHVIEQRYRKPEAVRLPPDPFFFFCLCDQRRMRPSRPVVCFAFAATEKVVIVLRIPRLRPRALRALDTAPRSATVSPNVRSTEGSGRRITVCAQRARLLRAGIARAALETSASCRFPRGLTQSSDKPAPPSLLPPSSLSSLSPPSLPSHLLPFSPPEVVQDEEERSSSHIA